MLVFDDTDTGKIYRIGEVAKELERDPQTIKKWEADGLIPKAKRDEHNWRWYTEDDIEEIRRIAEERGLIKKIQLGGYFIQKT